MLTVSWPEKPPPPYEYPAEGEVCVIVWAARAVGVPIGYTYACSRDYANLDPKYYYQQGVDFVARKATPDEEAVWRLKETK